MRLRTSFYSAPIVPSRTVQANQLIDVEFCRRVGAIHRSSTAHCCRALIAVTSSVSAQLKMSHRMPPLSAACAFGLHDVHLHRTDVLIFQTFCLTADSTTRLGASEDASILQRLDSHNCRLHGVLQCRSRQWKIGNMQKEWQRIAVQRGSHRVDGEIDQGSRSFCRSSWTVHFPSRRKRWV